MDENMKRNKAFAVALAGLMREHRLNAPNAVYAFGVVAKAMVTSSSDEAAATQELIHAFMNGFGMRVVEVDDDTADATGRRPDSLRTIMHDGMKWSETRRENERLARELDLAQRALVQAQDELARRDNLIAHLHDLLTKTADAMKGTPDPRMAHSWHDLPEWSAALRAVAMLYLAATAPGAGHVERDQFRNAISAWRALFGRDLFETAIAFAELDKGAP